MTLTEVLEGRRQIMAFVRAEPDLITLVRPTFATSGSGGVVQDDDETLDEQLFRLVPMKAAMVDEWGFARDGERILASDLVLVGAYDVDVLAKDHFAHDGQINEVISVSPKRLYRTAAHVRLRGPVDG